MKNQFTHFYSELNQSFSQLRRFGLVVGGVFLFIALIIEVSKGNSAAMIVCISFGVLLVTLGFIHPKILKYPYIGWMSLGFIMGLVVAPIILALIYYLFFSPISVCKRLFSSNESWIRYDTQVHSYWQPVNEDYQSEQSDKLY